MTSWSEPFARGLGLFVLGLAFAQASRAGAGETARGLKHLKAYSERRLLGDHVPYPVEAYPEGNQAHLSAESGLYGRVITEGLFGIRPTGFREYECLPRLPAGWQRVALRSIRAFDTEHDLAVERDGDKLLVTVRQRDRATAQQRVHPGEKVTVRLER